MNTTARQVARELTEALEGWVELLHLDPLPAALLAESVAAFVEDTEHELPRGVVRTSVVYRLAGLALSSSQRRAVDEAMPLLDPSARALLDDGDPLRNLAWPRVQWRLSHHDNVLARLDDPWSRLAGLLGQVRDAWGSLLPVVLEPAMVMATEARSGRWRLVLRSAPGSAPDDDRVLLARTQGDNWQVLLPSSPSEELTFSQLRREGDHRVLDLMQDGHARYLLVAYNEPGPKWHLPAHERWQVVLAAAQSGELPAALLDSAEVDHT